MSQETLLKNARLVLEDEVVTGSVLLRDGLIADVGGTSEAAGDDMAGDYLLPGLVVQWRSEDDVTLTMRNGVLIATRGLGGGVVSASARVEGDRPGPASGGARQLDIRAGDLDIRHVEFLCDLDDLGPERVVIVERAQATRHLRETCMAAGGGRVVNDYWIDSGGSDVVWQSRQWAGPEIGYIRTRRLTTG